MNCWQPSLKFFAQRAINLPAIANLPSMPLNWELIRAKQSPHVNGNFVTCRMQSSFGETFGGGDGIFLKHAATRAFAEAWERMWLKIIHSGALGVEPRADTSNGFAAGPTDLIALERARGELIERATMLTAWRSMRGWNPLIINSFWHNIKLRPALNQGWNIRWFLLVTKDSLETCAVLGTHQNKGAVFDCAYAGTNERDRSDAIGRLTNSLLRMIHIPRDAQSETQFKLPENAHPVDHKTFYSDPARLEAFRFLDNLGRAECPIVLPAASDIVSTLLHPAGTMPAVAVAYHPDYPVLNWGLQSICGKNPWPHPLA